MQTAISEYQPLFFSGQITRTGAETGTGISESATDILISQLVIRDTLKNGVDLPVAAFTFPNVAGIVALETNKPSALLTNTISYQAEDVFKIIRVGYIALPITDTVVKDQNLFYVHTAGGASPIHTFRADADTANASEVPVRALEGGVSGEIIECYIDVHMGIGVSFAPIT